MCCTSMDEYLGSFLHSLNFCSDLVVRVNFSLCKVLQHKYIITVVEILYCYVTSVLDKQLHAIYSDFEHKNVFSIKYSHSIILKGKSSLIVIKNSSIISSSLISGKLLTTGMMSIEPHQEVKQFDKHDTDSNQRIKTKIQRLTSSSDGCRVIHFTRNCSYFLAPSLYSDDLHTVIVASTFNVKFQ